MAWVTAEVFHGDNQGFNSIPVNISDGMTALYLSENNIKTLNDLSFSYSNFSLVQNVDLSSNGMKEISMRAFAGFIKLQDLNLKINSLINFEIMSSDVPMLTDLYLSYNKLSTFPTFNGYFEKLRILDVNNNNIKYVCAYDFENISNIDYLYFSHNDINVFETFYESGIAFNNLYFFHLSYNNFTLGHRTFAGFVMLQKLHLNKNNFAGFEIMSSDVPNLKGLYLKDNSLSKIPTFIGKLDSLTTMNLTGNSITFIDPESFANITNLRVLDLSYNNLIEFTSFAELPKLRKLDLSYNRLAKMPYFKELSFPPHKINWNLNSNEITKFILPENEIFSHFKEFNVNLMKNPVQEIPNILPYVKPGIPAQLQFYQAKLNCNSMCWMLGIR